MLETIHSPRALVALALGFAAAAASQARADYLVHNLVSDGAVVADHFDPNLQNPWGIAPNPRGPFWISDNGTGLSTLYNGFGVQAPLIVTIPGVGEPGNPTGTVFYSGAGFRVTDGAHSGPSRFMFANEDGLITGWSPGVNLTHALPLANRSLFGARYKGLAIASTGVGDFLYAANFGQSRVDVFDSLDNFVGSFTDPRMMAGYAPFGIQVLDGRLYVTYALKGPTGDDVSGIGHGFVDVFALDGSLMRRLVRHGLLNSPWGLAMAPGNFGEFSGDLLVGNFGDGRIHAYDPTDGEFEGTLRGLDHKPLFLDGLWGLQFGQGFVNSSGLLVNGATNELFFTAGLNDEADGLFGSIVAVADDNGDDD